MSVITSAVIRRESGEYDAEVVKRLRIERYGILTISNLEACTSLVDLSLAHNEITRMTGLQDLTTLVRLDLSHNKIKRIEQVKTLVNLEYLNLKANELESISEIDELVPLTMLTSLHLKQPDGSDSNPLCRHPSYSTSVMRVLPALQILDGGHLMMVDCSNRFSEYLETIRPSESACKTPPAQPWLKPQDLLIEGDALPQPPSPVKDADPSRPVASEVRPFHCKEHTMEALNLLENEIGKINEIIDEDSGLLLRKAATIIAKANKQ